MAVAGLLPGTVVANRFQIEKLAGVGGMGTIFRARDLYSGDVVALKLLRTEVPNPEESQRFAREAQLLAELHHPGIVSYVAHGQTPDGLRYLAMEWLQGEDLAQRLARGPLSVSDCLSLGSRVASALACAHERGVVHRDLKPSNLFLVGSEVGRVKLLDFGIARRLTGTNSMTRTGMVIGTPEYMAPEQARGSRMLTAAADLFSLGCILYECLSGQPPFVADHLAAVLVRILFEAPPALHERRPHIPKRLVSLIDRLLSKEPSDRPASGLAVAQEIEQVELVGDAIVPLTVAAPLPAGLQFAESERSLFSVVLAADPAAELGQLDTLFLSDGGNDDGHQELRLALTRMGVVAEVLASNSLVVTVAPMASAVDQATLAARAAILIEERWPGAVISLATGYGSVSGRTAVGEVVEQAARALHRSTPATGRTAQTGILIDPLSQRLLEGRFAQTPRPGGGVGLREEREMDSSRPLLGKPTPCVGREAELGTIEMQFRTCVEESEARVVVVLAPPGVGKSRLRHEFVRRLYGRSEPPMILQGWGDLSSAGSPYSIIGGAIRRLSQGSQGVDEAALSSDLQARLAAHLAASDERRIVTFLTELAGVRQPHEQGSMLAAARQDPRVMRDCVRQAFVDWLRAECVAAPVVLIFDDLQWGDALSIWLIDEALRELRDSPFFALALGRPELPELFPRLWQAHRPQEVPLKALGKKAAERLIHHVLGKQTPAAVVARIIEQSAGNALFIEELVRQITAGGVEDDGADTILAMLQARIGRLEMGARRVLLAASVFGETFWEAGVAQVLGSTVTSDELQRLLAMLREQEMIEPHSKGILPNQHEYGFHHALVRDASYALLTPRDREVGHRLVAEFLASAGERNWAKIAEHFERGNDPERAGQYFVQAGEWATGLCAYPGARKYFVSALSLINNLPPSFKNDRWRIDTVLKQIRSTHISEQPRKNLQRLEEASRVLDNVTQTDPCDDDAIRSAWLYYWRGRLLYYCDDSSAGIRYHEKVHKIVSTASNQEVVTLATSARGTELYANGCVNEALPLLEATIEAYASMGKGYEWVRAVGHRGICQIAMGLTQSGLAQVDLAHRRALEINQPIIVAMTHMYYPMAYVHMREWKLMLERAQVGLQIARECDEKIYIAICTGLTMWAQSNIGRFAEAEESYQNLYRIYDDMGGRLLFAALFDIAHADLMLKTGQIESALRESQRLALQAEHEVNQYALGLARRVLATARRAGGDPLSEESDQDFADSIAAFSRGGLVLDAAYSKACWAQALAQRGDAARAYELRAQAISQLQVANCQFAIESL